MTPPEITTHDTDGRASEDKAGTPAILVENLSIAFPGDGAALVSDVNFEIGPGEVLALVGESGSGKSITCKALAGLLPTSAKVGGRIEVAGKSVLDSTPKELRSLRGRRFGYVFQDPHRALNPSRTVRSQFCELLRVNLKLGRAAAQERMVELLDMVGISAVQHGGAYPHQLSGGLAQRVVIAMAMACDPMAVVADEPTTALDVSLQSQIMEMLTALCRERDRSLLVVSHDLAVVASVADRVAVMFAGRIVESGPTAQVLRDPRHPYTAALLASTLSHTERRDWTSVSPFEPGTPQDWVAGCAYRKRCQRAIEQCGRTTPVLEALSPGHEAACFVPIGAGRLSPTSGEAEAS